VAKTIRAAKKNGIPCITASGGVTCNRVLRNELSRMCEQNRFALHLAEKKFCTDNAAMIGILAERKLARQISFSSFDQEIRPDWTLA